MNDFQRTAAQYLACLLDIRRAVDNQFEGLILAAGICSNVHQFWEKHAAIAGLPWECGEVIDSVVPSWPEHSRMHYFPVPHPKYAPNEAYEHTHNKWVGEYGAARIRLLDWMIARLQEQQQ